MRHTEKSAVYDKAGREIGMLEFVVFLLAVAVLFSCLIQNKKRELPIYHPTFREIQNDLGYPIYKELDKFQKNKSGPKKRMGDFQRDQNKNKTSGPEDVLENFNLLPDNEKQVNREKQYVKGIKYSVWNEEKGDIEKSGYKEKGTRAWGANDRIDESAGIEKEIKNSESKIWESEKLVERILNGLEYLGGLDTVYCVGAKNPDLTGLLVNAVYDDGTRTQIPFEQCVVKGFDTKTAGERILTICYQGKQTEVPYEVAVYKAELDFNGGYCEGNKGTTYFLNDYTLQSVDAPLKPGCAFEGWYLDPELKEKASFPYRVSESERVIHLYAKWRELESPFIMTGGMLVDFVGTDADLNRGVLMLPEECEGIAMGAFRRNFSRIEELHLGIKVSQIEPNAFIGMKYLEVIDVDWKNPALTSINCAVHTKDKKRIIAYPGARTGTYNLKEKTETIGRYAFYESSLSALVLPFTMNSIENYAFGPRLKRLRFKSKVPPKKIEKSAFAAVSGELVIEVPQASVEMYRQVFSNINKKLTERIVGY